MAVTVEQIAEELNISFPLVSAVLTGKNYCRASKRKKQLILETAAKKDYRPNVNARLLAGNPSRVLGLLAYLHAAFQTITAWQNWKKRQSWHDPG